MAKREGSIIPISPEVVGQAGQMTQAQRRSRLGGFFDRIRQAWFGPGTPHAPMAPEGTPPRQFDFPVGINYRLTPRGEEQVSFPQLRAVADQCTAVRLCIETRKDQLEKFTWSIHAEDDDKPGKDDPRVKELVAFFRYPDRVNPWKQWLRMLLEEVLVPDATSVYIHRNKGGKPYALELLDGTSIRPMLDETGRRPLDGPAYQQIIKGVPASEFLVSELIYAPRNPRAHKIYGLCYSPDTEILTRRGWKLLEQVALDDEVATRNQATKQFEWQRPTHVIARPFDGELYRFHSRTVDLLVTPEHRMLVTALPRALGGHRGRSGEVLVPAAELAPHLNHEVKIPMTSRWVGVPVGAKEFRSVTAAVQQERLAALAPVHGGLARSIVAGSTAAEKPVRLTGDDYCALLGAYLAEGNLCAMGGIEIAQHATSKGFAAYGALVARALGGPAQHNGRAFILPRRGLTEHFRAFGHAHEKYVPDEVMNATPEQIQLFLDHYLLGDCHQERRVNRSGRGRGGAATWRASTVSKRLADQLVELAQKIGLSASVSCRPGGMQRVVGRMCQVRDCYRVSFRHSRAMGVRADRVAYRGPTYCVTVPNGVVYVRRHGKPAWCGNSPVEQLIFFINLVLRRDVTKMELYTEGTVPDALIGLPESWNIDQMAKFQAYWDSVMESGTAVRRKARFIPGDIARNYIATKEAVLKDEMDEWLMRIVCYAFSLPPTPFVKQMNRAVSETVQNTALEEGLLPIMEWVKALMDRIIQEVFGYADLAFFWQEVREPDPLVKAQTDEIYVRLGVKSVDDVAGDLGLPAPGMGPAVYLASGVTLVEDLVRMSKAAADQAENPPPPPPQLLPPGGGPDGGQPKQLTGPEEKPPGLPGKPDQADEQKTAAVGKVVRFRRADGPRALLAEDEPPQRIGFVQTLKADGPPPVPARDVREVGGLTIVVETPGGSVRHWGDEPDEQTTVSAPYGYVCGAPGMDSDSLDVFLGPMWAEAPDLPVLVVTITKPPDFTELDEEKVLIGWPDVASARRAFLEHYDQEARFIGREQVLAWPVFAARLGLAKFNPHHAPGVAKRASRRFIAQLSPSQRRRLAGAARDHRDVLRYQHQLELRILPVLRHVGVQVARQLGERLGKAAGDPTVEDALRDLKLDGFTLLAEPTKKILRAVATAGAKRSLLTLGVQDVEQVFDRANERAIAFADARAAAMVGMRWDGATLVPAARAEYQITEGTRELLRATIADAFREGQTKAELRDAIVADYAFSPERAALIARTEVSRAEVAGNMAGWRESGLVTGKRALLGSEHDIDDLCDDAADDGVIGLDEEFSNGETEPPFHVSCVCDVAPVLEGEEE